MTDIGTLGAHLPAGSALAQRAAKLVPLLDQHAAHADQEGRLAQEVVDALLRERLVLMWTPKELGGFELDPVQSLDVLAIASYGDASAGWVLMASSLAIGTGAAYLGASAVSELFAHGKHPMIAGQGTRPGTATRVDGGYKLTGSWSFASGLLHGTHTHSLAIIVETGEARIFVTPVAQADLKLDSWNVMGLRGTGSIDYTIDGVFVPEAYTHGAFVTEPLRGGAIFRAGIIGIAEICHSGWAIGVGRRLLDELGALIVSKAGRPGALSGSDSFQEKYAKLEASYRAARALVYETWTEATRTITAGSPMSVRQHTLIRLALGHITQALADLANGVYLLSGTTGLRHGTIERLVRDVHAGTQHVTSGPGMWQAAGRELAGLAPGKHWVLLDLVDD
ncbi:MAG TPA: acyl-CoA dehydrogenase family protein [Kofleriaceae bacterium]|jgi:alkylation response protein AidB-like acyl-CoA dehydrogenase|nr:acyl-CoA dehydrogenase family protein [Kofleriaceae bacterium]